MKTLLVAILITFCTIEVCYGQALGPIDRNDPAILALLEHSKHTNGLKASFVQEKHLKMLATPVIAKGIMRFQRPGRLRWEVSTPEASIAIVDGNAVKLSRAGVEQEVSGTDRQAYSAIADMIEGIVSGTMLDGKSMTTQFFRTKEGLTVELTPTDQRVAKRLKQIHLLFNAKDHSLIELRMDQPNGDHTTTHFTNVEFNPEHPAGSFDLP